jgi:peroxiredoxin
MVGLLLSTSLALAMPVGKKAPDFSLPATTADKVQLADYLGKKNLVLFFYIGAFTNL